MPEHIPTSQMAGRALNPSRCCGGDLVWRGTDDLGIELVCTVCGVVEANVIMSWDIQTGHQGDTHVSDFTPRDLPGLREHLDPAALPKPVWLRRDENGKLVDLLAGRTLVDGDEWSPDERRLAERRVLADEYGIVVGD